MSARLIELFDAKADTSTSYKCAPHREAFSPWDPTHLYIDDGGVVLCGAHMGVESTYMPHAFSDLGAANAQGVLFVFDVTEGNTVSAWCCEQAPGNFVAEEHVLGLYKAQLERTAIESAERERQLRKKITGKGPRIPDAQARARFASVHCGACDRSIACACGCAPCRIARGSEQARARYLESHGSKGASR